MGLFGKNPNETAYVGGKKHWTDVIKNSGDGSLLIWRQPEEDFNTNSTLIVMPGENAIFVKGGTIEQVFDNGTYKLSTENYPFISRLRNAFSGGISTFNCVVYFVRTAHSVEIKWGTESPIQVRDKMLGIATKLRARGAYKLQVANPAVFLEKLIGNNIAYQTQAEINKYFINEFQSKIKSVIARGVNESDTELIGIDAHLDELSEKIEPFMDETLSDYGLRCIKFSISAIDIDDNELRQKYDEIGIDAIAKMRNAQADRAVMDTLGDAWGKQQAVNIMSASVQNTAINGMANAGAGLGLGVAAGGVFGNMAQQIFAPANQPPQNQSPTPNQDDPMEVLGKMKKMLDAGLITAEEYDAKKKEIISKM